MIKEKVPQTAAAQGATHGQMSTTTTIIDGKNGSVPSSSMKVGKKSVTEDLVTTFSSPAAWLLVVALIVTWSAVAIVMFDLVDYKTLAGRSVHKLSTEPLRIIHETLEESSDWIYGFFSLLSDIVWSDDDDSDEEIQKQKTERPEKRTPAKVTSKDKLERQEKTEKKERHAAIHKEKPEKPEKQEKKAPSKVTQKDVPERHEKAEKKPPPKEEKKVKSTKVEAKIKKEVKDGKGEAKTAEKVKQAETKTTETGLIKAKTKVKEEKALQTVTKSDKKDQYAFCRYVIDMFAQGDFYPGSGGSHKEWCAGYPIVTNREGLVRDVKVGGCLGWSDHEIVECSIGQGGSRAASKIATMDFRTADFSPFRDLLGRIPQQQIL
ncbi:hypothetical protein DUI87_10570 [Hirundo rustica rustica]|uniref:Triadin n=1 Tax=Hirundo rustica rustica TaxID=333673 RepID=A0A3M0KQ92_HIRRU|nr:hypothetical protein DUI87_10570 [Hirundo rustica rustica]